MRSKPIILHFAEYLAAKACLRTLEWLPRSQAERLAHAVLRALARLIPRFEQVGHRNLALALPTLDELQRRRILEGMWVSLGRVLASLAKFPQLNRENIHDWIEYEGYEHYREAKAAGRGVIFVTGHLGNWELSAFAHALMSEPLNVVVRPLDNPFLDRLLEQRRQLSGNRIIPKSGAAAPILAALRRNEAVGILVDQNTSADEGVFVKFFGVLACSTPAPARLAARTGAAVIPGFALWVQEKQRYVLRFYPPIALSGDPLADTQAIQSQIERVIREYPDQWLWIHRRWKTRPPGEKSLY